MNPQLKTIQPDRWVKVAENVSSGYIKAISKQPTTYYETYRMTGNPAPTQFKEGAPWQGLLEISTMGQGPCIFSRF